MIAAVLEVVMCALCFFTGHTDDVVCAMSFFTEHTEDVVCAMSFFTGGTQRMWCVLCPPSLQGSQRMWCVVDRFFNGQTGEVALWSLLILRMNT